MYTNITDIAIALKLDIKIVAEIYKQWFMNWLNTYEQDLNKREILKEIDWNIYN
jgi:hypothetical protein